MVARSAGLLKRRTSAGSGVVVMLTSYNVRSQLSSCFMLQLDYNGSSHEITPPPLRCTEPAERAARGEAGARGGREGEAGLYRGDV